MWWAGLITVLLLFWISQKLYLLNGHVKNRIQYPLAPGYKTLLSLHAKYSTYPGPSGSQNIWWNGNVLLKSLLMSFSHSEWLCKSDCKTKMNMTFKIFKKQGKGKGDLSPKQSLLCLGTVGRKRFGLPIRWEGRGGTYWAQLFEGRLTLTRDYILICVPFSLVQKLFSGKKILYSFFRASSHQNVNKKN